MDKDLKSFDFLLLVQNIEAENASTYQMRKTAIKLMQSFQLLIF